MSAKAASCHLGITLGLLCAASSALASDHPDVSSRFEFLMDAARVQSSATSANGFGLDLGYLYPFSSKWALRLSMGQDFALDGFGSLFSEFQLSAAYAVVGSHTAIHQRVETGQGNVLETEARSDLTVSIVPIVSQYFFSATTRILGVSAFGLGIHAVKPLDDRWLFTALLRASRGSVSETTLMPIQLSLGLSRDLD